MQDALFVKVFGARNRPNCARPVHLPGAILLV